MTIPKIVYAVWCGPNPLPERDCFIDSWQEKLPGYDIHLLGDVDIPSSACTRAALDRGKIVTAAQYAAWSRLYETGGIYLDLDIDIIRPLDDLLAYDAFIGVENDGPSSIWAACGILGASPRNPFIRECLDYMDRFDHTHSKMENELGPRMFTNLLVKHGWKRQDADATIKGVRILKSKRFYPYSWQQEFKPECVTAETYAVHHWSYSWKPRTSVVIPCYNQGKYLAEAIESVLAQTEAALEIVVVDDGSTDDTARVAARYPQVKLIRQKNAGVSAARNAGVRATTAPGIICLDADDKLHPKFIETLAGLEDIVSCDLRMFGAHTGRWSPPMQAPKLEHITKNNMLLSGSLFSRQFWEAVGGYDEKMRDGYEDWDFWVRCMAAGAHAWVVREELFEYRTYKDGERVGFSNSFAVARTNDGALTTKMRAKWAALGIAQPKVPSPPPIHYPVPLGIDVTYLGKHYVRGTKIDHATALGMRKAGLLSDTRIV